MAQLYNREFDDARNVRINPSHVIKILTFYDTIWILKCIQKMMRQLNNIYLNLSKTFETQFIILKKQMK